MIIGLRDARLRDAGRTVGRALTAINGFVRSVGKALTAINGSIRAVGKAWIALGAINGNEG